MSNPHLYPNAQDSGDVPFKKRRTFGVLTSERMPRTIPPLVRLVALAAGLAAGAASTFAAGSFESTPRGNLERLEECAATVADSILSTVGARDSLCLAIVPHDAAWLLERALVERASARGVSVQRCEAADARRLDVAIASIGVVYSVTDDDAIERRAALSISASAPAPITEAGRGAALRTFRVEAELVDTLAHPDTAGLAIASYPFTVGTMPAADSGGFWSKIVEPAVVLAAAAIVAILLFTVRSQ